MDCRYSLGGCNEYPQSMFWAEIWKISAFLSENFQILVVKCSIYLNGRVFVMIIIRTMDTLDIFSANSAKRDIFGDHLFDFLRIK